MVVALDCSRPEKELIMLVFSVLRLTSIGQPGGGERPRPPIACGCSRPHCPALVEFRFPWRAVPADAGSGCRSEGDRGAD